MTGRISPAFAWGGQTHKSSGLNFFSGFWVSTIVKIASFLRVFKNRRSKFLDHSEVFDKLIGSSTQEVHRLLHIRYQRTQENGSFPFSDILTLMSSCKTRRRMQILLRRWTFKGWIAFSFRGPWTVLTPSLNHSYRRYACCLTPTFQHLPRSMRITKLNGQFSMAVTDHWQISYLT